MRTLIVAALALLLGVSAAAAQPVAKASFMAEGSFALPTSGPGALERPRAIAWAGSNQIHIADERGTVVVLDGAGAFVRTYGAGVLRRTAGLAVDAGGRSYVLDPEQKMVVVFDPAGEVVHRIGSPGNAAGQLDDPVDIALGPTGLVYVLDKGRRGVQLFSLDGTFVHDLVLGEEVEDPRALGVSPAGLVFVAAGNLPATLLRFPELTVALGTVDVPAKFAPVDIRSGNVEEPVAVVTTRTGTVVTADRETGVLWAVDGQGRAPVGSDDRLYGGSGSGRGSFRRLEDAAVAGTDQLVMLDSEGRKVERVRLVVEDGRAAEAVMDYPVQFQRVESALSGGVLATAPRTGGTSWFALADPEGRNLRVVEARMVEARGVFGNPIRRPQAAGAPHSFGSLVERAGHVAMNDTLMVVTEPRRNRFHVFDLRNDTHIGAFGDSYSDSRRLRSPRGVALFADGRIAVADHDNDRVAVFSADLATLLGTFPLLKAEGVTISADGRLFAWDEEGLQVGEFPLAGGPFAPLGTALSTGGVGAVASDVAGNVYVLRRRSGRVTVLNAAMGGRLLARMGPERGIENGDHVAVDVDGNVYATDLEKAATVVLRWGVDVPPVATIAARWEPTFAELTWSAVPGSFVTGYQVEGASAPEGPWSRVAATTQPTARVQDPALRYFRVAPRTLTGGVGLPSPVVPALHLAAAAAFAAGEWERTRPLVREALAVLTARGAEATPAAVQALHWAGFVSAHQARDWADVLVWQRLVGDSPPTGKAFEHLYRLADAHQQLGELRPAVDRAVAALAIAARDPSAPAEQVTALRELVFADAWELGLWEQVASMGDEILRAAPGNRDPVFLERLARAQIESGAPQRALDLLAPMVAGEPTAATRRLLVVSFMAVAALEDYPRAMELATAIGNTMDGDLFVPFQGTLARVRFQTGDHPGARRELLALLADPRDRRALADASVARSLMMVYGGHVETGDPEGGRALLDSMVAVLPADLGALRTSVLQRADSAGAVADTRAKLGEGFQFYRDALFRDALRFFQEADARTDLDVDQRLIVKVLLAGTLYSLAQVEAADEIYRGVFGIDPQFNLVDHLERVTELYGLSVYGEDMLTHFLGIAPLL